MSKTTTKPPTAAEIAGVLGGVRQGTLFGTVSYRIPHVCGGEIALKKGTSGLAIWDRDNGSLGVRCFYGCEIRDARAAVAEAVGEPLRFGGSGGYQQWNDAVAPREPKYRSVTATPPEYSDGQLAAAAYARSVDVCPNCGGTLTSAIPIWAEVKMAAKTVPHHLRLKQHQALKNGFNAAPYLELRCSGGCSYHSIHSKLAAITKESVGSAWRQDSMRWLADGQPRWRYRIDPKPAEGRSSGWDLSGKGRTTTGAIPLQWQQASSPDTCRAIAVVEGDKAAAGAASADIPGVSIVSTGDTGGMANAWYGEIIASGVPVIIIPDRDAVNPRTGQRPGEAAAAKAALRLYETNAVVIADVSDLKDGEDAADMRPSDIRALVDAAVADIEAGKTWTPPASAGGQQQEARGARAGGRRLGRDVLISVAEIGRHYGLAVSDRRTKVSVDCPVCNAGTCNVFYVAERVGVRCEGGNGCRPADLYLAIESAMGRGNINRLESEERQTAEGQSPRYQSIPGLPPTDERENCTKRPVVVGTSPNEDEDGNPGQIWKSFGCDMDDCPGCESNRCWVNRRRLSLGIVDGQTQAWVAGFGTLKEANAARRQVRRTYREPAVILVVGRDFCQKDRRGKESPPEEEGLFGQSDREHAWFVIVIADQAPATAEIARRDAVVRTKAAAVAKAASEAFAKTEVLRRLQQIGKAAQRASKAAISAVKERDRRAEKLAEAAARRAALGYWHQMSDVMTAVDLAGTLPSRWEGEAAGDPKVNAISWGTGVNAWWVDIAISDSAYEVSGWKPDPFKQGVPGGGWLATTDTDRAWMKLPTEPKSRKYAEKWCAGMKPIPIDLVHAIMRNPAIRRHKSAMSRANRIDVLEATGYAGPAQLIWDAIRFRCGFRGWRDAFEFVKFETWEPKEWSTATVQVGCFVCEDEDYAGCEECMPPTPKKAAPDPDPDEPTFEEFYEVNGGWFCSDCGTLGCNGIDCQDEDDLFLPPESVWDYDYADAMSVME